MVDLEMYLNIRKEKNFMTLNLSRIAFLLTLRLSPFKMNLTYMMRQFTHFLTWGISKTLQSVTNWIDTIKRSICIFNKAKKEEKSMC